MNDKFYNKILDLCNSLLYKHGDTTLTEFEVLTYEASCNFITEFCNLQTMIIKKQMEENNGGEVSSNTT